MVSPGMRATGMTSSGVGWVSTSEALSFLDGEAGPPSAAICESMRTASAAANGREVLSNRGQAFAGGFGHESAVIGDDLQISRHLNTPS